MQTGLNSFVLTPKQWIDKTGAVGITSSAGRYGGTYAHKDIAFEFASWVSVEFKLYLELTYLQTIRSQASTESLLTRPERCCPPVCGSTHYSLVAILLGELSGRPWAPIANQIIFGLHFPTAK